MSKSYAVEIRYEIKFPVVSSRAARQLSPTRVADDVIKDLTNHVAALWRFNLKTMHLHSDAVDRHKLATHPFCPRFQQKSEATRLYEAIANDKLIFLILIEICWSPYNSEITE